MPTSTFDHLALELLKHGYHCYDAIHLYCPLDGLFRLNLPANLNAANWPCPICKSSRECSRPITRGVCRRERELPEWTRLIPAVPRDVLAMIPVDPDTIVMVQKLDPRTCAQCRQPFTPSHGNQTVCEASDCHEARQRDRQNRRYHQRARSVAAAPA